MSWLGPTLNDEQQDVLSVLTALVDDHDVELSDDPAPVAAIRRQLAGLGFWTQGAAEAHGGGGADRTTTTIVLERIGRRWPALGLASAHAHAATDALGPFAAHGDLVKRVHAGLASVAIIDGAAEHVRLRVEGAHLTGVIDRIDIADVEAHVLLLRRGGAMLVEPPAIAPGRALVRTGLAGAQTCSVAVRGRIGGSVHELPELDVRTTRTRFHLSAAAVAAGLAGAAFDAAADYAALRHQFGGPLTALVPVRRSLDDQAVRVATALSATTAGGPHAELVATATLRVACAAAVDVAAAALQTHGGYGYLTEYPAERILRDAVSFRAALDVAGIVSADIESLIDRRPTSLDAD